jgi:LacI family transcriptional regulator
MYHMPIRISDIAKEAAVSPAAVSLALNNKPGVSGEVRQKIINTANRLGYKSLFTEQYRTINENISIRFLKIAKHGRIINDHHNAFITEYLEGIEQAAMERKYKLEVSFYNRTPIEEIIMDQRDAKISGFIILGTEIHDHELDSFTGLSAPIVFIDTCFPHSIYDCIDMDNMDGVFKAIQHLYTAGHRNIGLIKSSYETRNFKLREFGFREAMDYFSLPVQEQFIISVDPTVEGSLQDMLKFLDHRGGLPSAFFCMNDIIAYGVMRTLKTKGLRIPEDMSIIGFDDLPSSAIAEPPLTTIRVSTQQIGRRALEKVSERIINPWDQATENILISGKLIVRNSVNG